jgi:teichoic acid transport system permease protein
MMTQTPEARRWTAADAERAGLRPMGVRPQLRDYLPELWARREFALLVPLGDMRQRSMDTVLGGAWHLLNPLIQAGIYYLLFGVILRQRGEVDNYAAWLIIGLFVFAFTQKSVQSSSRIIVAKAQMLRSLNFPAAILPMSVNLSELLAHLPALVVMVGVVLATGVTPEVTWLLLPLVTGLQLVFNLGLSLAVARLTVHFRDMDHLLTHVLRLWFYFSGILFPVTLAPEGPLRTLLTINPPHTFIAVARGLLLEGRIDGPALSLAVMWTLASLVIGGLWFHRFEGRYANAA